MLLSDEVYTLLYFNDHITTLLISDQTQHMLYRQHKKKSKRRFKVLYVICKG